MIDNSTLSNSSFNFSFCNWIFSRSDKALSSVSSLAASSIYDILNFFRLKNKIFILPDFNFSI